MAKTELLAPPGLQAQVAEASREASRLRDASDALQAQFNEAVTAERFTDAQNLKAQLPQAQTAAAMAEARVRALQDVAKQLADEYAEREQAVQAEARTAQARLQLESLREAEREALDQVHRRWSEAVAGVAAVRESLQAAVDAEQAVHQSRVEQDACLVVLESRPRNAYVARPNFASSKIEGSPALQAILRGRV